MVALSHGFRIMAIWRVEIAPWDRYINLVPWLTLPCCFAHKRADREPDIGHAFLTSSMAVQPSFRWVWSDGVAGECPEWQRELTVNQPSYDFEGSSPSSPTILKWLRNSGS